VFAIALVSGGIASGALRDARDHGAAGDGRTKDTGAVQAAINACEPGDTLVFRAGVFLCGALELQGEVTYRIEPSATILGSRDIADYPKHRPAYANYTRDPIARSLLYAFNQTNITLTGGGVIDGHGGAAEPGAEGNGGEDKRVSGTRFYQCRNLKVAGITLRNFNLWGNIIDHCDTVLFDHAVIDNGIPNAHNQDGVDIQDSVNVLFQDCYIRGIDDALCLKSWSASGISNVVARNCTLVSPVHNAFKIGTYTVGPIQDIVLSNCTLICPGVTTEARLGTAVAIEAVDGSDINGVTVTDCRIRNHGTPFFIRLGNRDANRTGKTGSIQNVLFARNRLEGASPADDLGCMFTGLPGRKIKNVVVRDMEICKWGGSSRSPEPAGVPEKEADYPECGMFGILPAYGFFVRHAEKVTFENLRIGWAHADSRPWLATLDAEVVTNHCGELGQLPNRSDLVCFVEAETATNLPPSEMAKNVSASGGGFVSCGGSVTNAPLQYPFTLTETTDVDLMVRLRHPGPGGGSAFRYRMDDAAWRAQPAYRLDEWTWTRLHADARHFLKGGSFPGLRPGRHVLSILGGDSNTELDVIRVSGQEGAIHP
jgi:hypothetical protein